MIFLVPILLICFLSSHFLQTKQSDLNKTLQASNVKNTIFNLHFLDSKLHFGMASLLPARERSILGSPNSTARSGALRTAVMPGVQVPGALQLFGGECQLLLRLVETSPQHTLLAVFRREARTAQRGNRRCVCHGVRRCSGELLFDMNGNGH